LIGLHDETGEKGQEGLHVVLAGAVRFELDGEVLELLREDVVAVRDRGVRRRVTALEPGSAMLVIGGPPGNLRRSAWRPEWFCRSPNARRQRPTRPPGLTTPDRGHVLNQRAMILSHRRSGSSTPLHRIPLHPGLMTTPTARWVGQLH
jgi:hypothetical protein